MNPKKIFLSVTLTLSAFVFLFGLVIWVWNSPILQDYYLIHDRKTESDLAFAFAVSLRNNDPAAYEMIDPSLKPRLDDWMNVHQAKRCAAWADTVFGGRGSKKGHIVIIDCAGKNKWLSFTVDNIVIEDMHVVDWGEVKEE